MLETMSASTTFVKQTNNNNSNSSSSSDPLLWECQQFPDSNTKFSPIKQEVVDSYEGGVPQSDFTELKPMSFDYGSNSLTGVDPVLSNNNNNNNNSRKPAADQHLNIYIKPLSPPEETNRESFCFNASPSDVTSSGSVSPPGIIKIDYPTGQDAFDDIANIVGISMGADSTVPTLEDDLDAWIENTASNIKQHQENGYETILSTSSSPNSETTHSISNVSMNSTQPYLNPLPSSALANLLTQSKLPRATSLEERNPFPTILSPILRSQLTGYQAGNYPNIKQEPVGYDGGPVIKQEYFTSSDQMPHSTVGSLVDHRRLGLDNIRANKPKPPKPRPVSHLFDQLPFMPCLSYNCEHWVNINKLSIFSPSSLAHTIHSTHGWEPETTPVLSIMTSPVPTLTIAGSAPIMAAHHIIITNGVPTHHIIVSPHA